LPWILLPAAPMILTLLPEMVMSGLDRPPLDGVKDVVPENVTLLRQLRLWFPSRPTVAPDLRFRSMDPPAGTVIPWMVMLLQLDALESCEYDDTLQPWASTPMD
jgi:hypothetical protein